MATQKHDDFLGSPIGNKRVTDLPGIGDAFGQLLVDNGFDRAYKVLGQFLILGKSEVDFTHWLTEICPAINAQHQQDCYEALNQWCIQNM